MRIVTGFSASVEEQEEKVSHPLLDYLQTIEALEHDLTVVGNCFARAAKKTLHGRLPDARLLKSSDSEGHGLPLWVSENSVAFYLNEKKYYSDDWDSFKTDRATKLFELTETLADTIEKASKDRGELILVDALKLRVLEVGPQMYRFTVKQMWSIE